jgi:glycosyltransferase domain-containing protein
LNNYLNELSVCILTKDRPENLDRQVNYFKRHEVKVLVLDASNAPHSVIENEFLEYHHLPGVEYHKRLLFLVNLIKTKFIVLQADDDFHGILAMSSSVEFLVNSPNFSSTQGSYIRFHSKWPFTWLPDYQYQNQLNIASEDPLQRAIALSNSEMHFVYSVMRTDVFIEIVQCLENIEIGILAMNELVFLFTLGLFGEYKTLQHFYSARDGVQQSTNHEIPFEDWENSSEGREFRNFKMNIIRLYSLKANISLSKADAIVTEVFDQYKIASLKRRQKHALQAHNQKGQGGKLQFRSLVKKLVFTRVFIPLYPFRKMSTWIYVRNLIEGKSYFSFKEDLKRIKSILTDQK